MGRTVLLAHLLGGPGLLRAAGPWPPNGSGLITPRFRLQSGLRKPAFKVSTHPGFRPSSQGHGVPRPRPGLYFSPVLISQNTQLIFLLIEQFCVDSSEDL